MKVSSPESSRPHQSAPSSPIVSAVLWCGVAIQGILAGMCFLRAFAVVPHGMWDAWGFWNTKARILYLAGENWRGVFDPAVPHPDYPLLLPFSVVRLWEWEQSASPFAAFLASTLYVPLVAGLLFAFLRATRNASLGLVAMVVFLSTDIVLEWGGCQYADLPLTYYILAAAGCGAMALQPGASARPWLIALGMLLGAAAFTKNEGLPLFGLGMACTSVILVRFRRWPELLGAILGAIPWVAAILTFKLSADQGSEFFAQPAREAMAKIAAADRHRMIWEYACSASPNWLPWIAVLAIVMGFRRPPSGWLGYAVLALPLMGLVAVYYLTYLITPHELDWHLDTSCERLALQVWPAFLFLIFYAVRTPEEMFCRASAATNPSQTT